MAQAIVNIGQFATHLRHSQDFLVSKDAFLVINGPNIIEIGTGTPPPVDDIFDAEGGVVLPGFVDAHTHLIFGGNRSRELEWRSQGRSYQDISALGGGIRSTIQATRQTSEEELFQIGLKHLTWCLQSGTTTLEAKSGYGQDVETEINLLLAIHRVDSTFCQMVNDTLGSRVVPTFLGLHAVPPEFESASDYTDFVISEILPIVTRAKLATSVDAFIESGYFDQATTERFLTAARAGGLDLRLHVDQLTEGSGAQFAARCLAKSADHLENMNDSAIGALLESGTFPVLLPGSVLGLGLTQYPHARAMLDAGLPVVLATDFNPGSSPTPSIPFVMALSCRMLSMTPKECLKAVTITAADSLGFYDRGSLEVGAKADFSIWPMADWEEVATWICGPRPNQVWANGVRVL